MTDSQRILDAIGHESMQKLIDAFGGTKIYVPLKVPEPHRDERIRSIFSECVNNGSTCMSAYHRCADEFELSERRVREIVAS